MRVVTAVYAVDGLRGFYRGFWASMLMFCPSTMIFWLSYYDVLLRLKRWRALWLSDGQQKDLERLPYKQQKLLALQATSGLIGGVFAAAVTNPLEVFRVRIQVSQCTCKCIRYVSMIRRCNESPIRPHCGRW